MNYARFINTLSAGRYLQPLRKLTEIQAAGGPSLISLGTGAPNPSCFPFEKIVINTKDQQQFVLDGKLLNTALSYGASSGVTELINWLKELQIRVHQPKTINHAQSDAQLDLIVTPGSQDGLSKTLEMLVNPGDFILIEEPTYPGSLAVLKPYKLKFLNIQSDEHGIKPESLKKLLSPWTPEDARKPDVQMPKVLVVQPNHCNPSGVSLPLERRREIYKIAQDYDLVILEDDPYYYLTFGSNPPPSFLSIDTDGRVIRFDSFSKVMSAGIRLGICTGPKALVRQVLYHLGSTSSHCSTLSQYIVLELLKSWGHDTFLQHGKKVADFYESQCRLMLEAAQTHLTGLAEWFAPTGGMFLWFKVNGVTDTYKMIMEKALSKQVVLAPGSFFMIDDKKPSSYLRASFSNASKEQMQEAFKRLAELIKEEQDTKNL